MIIITLFLSIIKKGLKPCINKEYNKYSKLKTN